ncbi:hypothetical protein GN956_G9674 [Arapaima gigas]
MTINPLLCAAEAPVQRFQQRLSGPRKMREKTLPNPNLRNEVQRKGIRVETGAEDGREGWSLGLLSIVQLVGFLRRSPAVAPPPSSALCYYQLPNPPSLQLRTP